MEQKEVGTRLIDRAALRNEVETLLRHGRRIVFNKDSLLLTPLADLMEQSSHVTVVAGALECANTTLERFEALQGENERPRVCLETCSRWAHGLVVMPIAKRAILDCHAAANEYGDREAVALCHAVAQAGSTVNCKGHAMGLPLYELTAIVHRYRNTHGDYIEAVVEKSAWFLARLVHCHQETAHILQQRWAGFLVK